MSYEVFQTKVFTLIERAGGEIKVRFSHDEGNGRYFATCSDGTVISAGARNLKATVRWGGKNHQSMVTL